MKKQIVTLMLSAAIFTTNPLFAMDSEEKSEEKGGMHKCPSCDSKLEFQKINEAESKGALFFLPNDVLVKTLSFLPLEDVVHDVSLVSKAMYNLCQTPFIWENIAQREKITIQQTCCPKDEIVWYWSGVFSGSKDSYIIPISELKTFMTTLSPAWTEQDIAKFGTVKYQVTRENKFFSVQQNNSNKNFFYTTLLPFLANDAEVTFTKTGYGALYPSFYADIYVLPASPEYQTLSSPEYKKLINEAKAARNPELRGARYTIQRWFKQ